MLLRRDLMVITLTLGIAIAIYLFSFRDLAIADPALSGIEVGAASQQLVRAPASIPASAG